MKRISPLVVLVVSLLVTACAPVVARHDYYGRYDNEPWVYVYPSLRYWDGDSRYYRTYPRYSGSYYDRYKGDDRYGKRHRSWSRQRDRDRDNTWLRHRDRDGKRDWKQNRDRGHDGERNLHRSKNRDGDRSWAGERKRGIDLRGDYRRHDD